MGQATDNGPSENRVIHERAARIALLLILIVGCYFVGRWSGAFATTPPATHSENSSGTESSPLERKSVRTSQERGNNRRNVEGGSNSSDPKITHTNKVADPIRQLCFRFVENSVAASGVKFRYQLRNWDDFNADLLSTQPAVEYSAERYPFSGESGVDGKFEVPNEVLVAVGGQVFGFRIALDQVGWKFASQGDYPGPIRSGEFAHGTNGNESEYNVPVFQDNTVFFIIRYEDGVSYAGKVTVTIDIGQRQSVFTTHRVNEGESLTVQVPRKFRRLDINIMADRQGFVFTLQKFYSDEELRPTQELTLARDPTQNHLYVHLTNWPTGEPVKITYWTLDGYGAEAGQSKGGEVWDSFRVVRMGHLIVEVAGASGFWRSETILTGEAEKIELYPHPTQAVTYRVRFVDKEGKVVAPARFRVSSTPYPEWMRIVRQSPDSDPVGSGERFVSFGGTTGVAELTHIMPGKRTLVAEAFGYEAVNYEVDGKPGQVVDLGDVPLVPAKGKIEVRLVGARKGIGYYVWLRSPDTSSAIDLVKDVTTASASFEKISVRDYALDISAGNGGRGKNIPVKFEPGSSTVIVEVDVSALEPPEKK